ncbi:hypothetical protein ACHQM5_012295 [Ranunculus cassubicifolius]
MKASLKFKEDPKTPPLLRVKIPLNILGFPFQSGVSACGDSKDLGLNLGTFFDSGPSLKLIYKPNDSWNPFSLIVKTGIGPFGSPNSACLSMSAEFNLLSRGNPSFFLRFNPQFGDFGLKKMAGSQAIMKSLEHSKGFDVGEKANGWLERVNGNVNGIGNVIDGVFNGVEMSAKTVLPIRNKAILKFSWGVRMPEEMIKSGGIVDGNMNDRTAWDTFSRIPFLVMNKISIEHLAKSDSKKVEADVAKKTEEACFDVKRQLDMLHAENGYLRRAVEEIRSEIGVGSLNSGKFGSRRSGERKALEGNGVSGFPGKLVEMDGNEEAK